MARAARKKDREAGLIEAGPPIGPAEQSEFLVMPEDGESPEESQDEAEVRAEDKAEA